MPGTIKQIAQLSGVSRGTVDRVLNHRGRVDPEVARRVEQIAEELGYLTRTQRKAGGRQAGAGVEGGKRIGVVTQLSGASFMIEVRRGIEEIARKLAFQGIDVVVRECPDVDEQMQIKMIEELVEEGIDGLAIMPVDCAGVGLKLNQLIRERGIPVITFNTDIVGVEKLAFVGLDNRNSGRAAAGLMAMMMQGKGTVLGIVGNFSNSAGMQRIDGFAEELKKSFPDMTLIGVRPSGDRTAQVASIVTQALSAFPDLGGILQISGGQAGLRQALARWDKERRPCVVMYDATPKNAALMKEGIADFIIDQDGYTQGYRTISLLADKLRWDKDPEKEYMYTDINIRTRYTC